MKQYDLDFSRINTVSILFWGRSGSIFMGSLLDSHESIFTVPDDILTNFFDKDGFWNKNKDIKDKNNLLDSFCRSYDLLFNEKYDYGYISKKDFKEHMLNFSKYNSILNRKSFFIALHYSYTLCLNQDISNKHIINYQMHDSSIFTRMNSFLEDFPNAKFLAMYRDPIRALHSHLRMHKDQINLFLEDKNLKSLYSLYTWRKTTQSEIDRLLPSDEYKYTDEVIDGQYLRYYIHQLVGWKKALFQFKLNLKSVRLENLHDKPELTMKSIASYLDIEYNSELLNSTFNGKPFYSGKLNGIQNINGFSSSHTRLSKYKESFNDQDVYVLNNILSRLYEEYFHLRDDALPLDKLIELICIPTKVEFLAMDETYGSFKYDLVMDSYRNRMNISKELLTMNFTEYALDGFYR